MPKNIRERRWGIVIFFLSAVMIISCGKTGTQKDIYGLWKGDFQGGEIAFKFKNNQTCELIFKDKTAASTQVLNGNFEIDFSKKPILLSIKGIPQLSHALYTIIEFKGNDTIKLANFSPRWRTRPVTFGRGTSFYLKRVKENN